MKILYDCEICGGLHPWEWDGDCRDDANRYGSVEDYIERTGTPEFDANGHLQIEVRSMEERIQEDENA